MGIRVPPEPDPFENDCLACYDPGKTPKYLYAIFGGIEHNRNIMPGSLEPPNGSYRITQDPLRACRWILDGKDWFIEYYANGSPLGPTRASSLVAIHLFFDISFWATDTEPCTNTFRNELTIGPAQPWGGGAAWVLKKC